MVELDEKEWGVEDVCDRATCICTWCFTCSRHKQQHSSADLGANNQKIPVVLLSRFLVLPSLMHMG